MMEHKYVRNSGERVMEVQSIGMRTGLTSPLNALYPDSAGQHYCDLFSPARAMDWNYTDGLRWKLGSGAQLI